MADVERGIGGRGTGVALALLLGLTLVGEPAPSGIGPVEVLLVGGVVLLATAALMRARHLGADRLSVSHATILAGLAIYCLSQLLTLGRGILAGAPPGAALRAVGPYLVFLPLAALLPWLPGGGRAGPGVRALVVAGLAHAAFLLTLFVTGVQDLLDLRAVFLGRTTLLDARTTVPLFLASVLLPLAWLPGATWRRRLVAVALVLLSAAGALTTQTRSQLLAIACGGAVFLLAYAVWWARTRGRALSHAAGRLVAVGAAAMIVAAVVVSTVPPLRLLARAVVLRTASAQDNGRLANEWLPAVQQVSASPAHLALGVGAGETFITAEGEERTYVHNLSIYSLVYGGIAGLCATAVLYLAIGAGLARRARHESDLEAAALLALFVAMVVYAQFFAVHKLLSYNLMLAILAGAAAGPAARGRPA